VATVPIIDRFPNASIGGGQRVDWARKHRHARLYSTEGPLWDRSGPRSWPCWSTLDAPVRPEWAALTSSATTWDRHARSWFDPVGLR
jgi:hypothetical protein